MTLRIDRIARRTRRGTTRCEARVSFGRRRHRVWYEFEGGPPLRPGDALAIDACVSEALLENLDPLQSRFRAWEPALQRIDVEPRARAPAAAPEPARGRALFFTGGVDSFYSVLTEPEAFDRLVFVHGFDVPIGRREHLRLIQPRLAEAARQLDLPLQLVRTNLREVTRRLGCDWEMDHGGALASVAHMLSGEVAELTLSASFVQSSLRPWGSHPAVDPLFSSHDTTLCHRGDEAARIEKLARIAEHPATWDSLRVCWQNRPGLYNCGACAKCFRTVVGLAILGVLERYGTLPHPVDLERLAAAPTDATERRFAEQHLEAALRLGADPQIVTALRASLAAPP